MKFEYWKNYFDSYKDIFKNPVLLLPQTYLFLLGTLYLIVLVLTTNPVGEPSGSEILISTILLIVYILISLLFYSSNVTSFKLFVDKKKVTAKKQIDGGITLYWKIVKLILLRFMLVALPIIVLIIIADLLPVGILTTIVIVAAMIYLIYAILNIIFSDVLLAEKNSAKKALTESFKIFKQHRGHVVKTFLPLVGAGIIYMAATYILSGIIFPVDPLNPDTNTQILGSIFTSLLTIPLYASTMLYLFKARPTAKTSEPKKALKTKKKEVKKKK